MQFDNAHINVIMNRYYICIPTYLPTLVEHPTSMHCNIRSIRFIYYKCISYNNHRIPILLNFGSKVSRLTIDIANPILVTNRKWIIFTSRGVIWLPKMHKPICLRTTIDILQHSGNT